MLPLVYKFGDTKIIQEMKKMGMSFAMDAADVPVMRYADLYGYRRRDGGSRHTAQWAVSTE